ncbi:uncharacterized protein B0I36DRAFT_431006 [Microdochium trichocladiopsis]|uniref:GH64 domain-containing protein n=1 Tax=Microdochium trichocladiopsis TaxID=1682393 RepID=A0A9P8Y8H5_9PEZI|nr:uncharacterized protein B0I36DRAFT_431006 [Microdochium trichocladiopsis]KAH7030734.1 hypothetical protein B0I36DRAFT_431006 [Microdochium trichocladiopsis]
MRPPPLRAATITALAVSPYLAAALATGFQHTYPRRDGLGRGRSGSIALPPFPRRGDSSLTVSASVLPSTAPLASPPSPLPHAGSSGGTVTTGVGAEGDTFQLNILNRQVPDKDLWVYIEGQDIWGRPGFIMPNKDPTAPATWFLPDARGGTNVDVPNEVIGMQMARNTGSGNGNNNKPPVLSLRMPDNIVSGRVYLSEDPLVFRCHASNATFGGTTIAQPSALLPSNDPASKARFGFVELTWRSIDVAAQAKRGIYANLSFVDWVGMLLGMSIKEARGAQQDKHVIPGLKGKGGITDAQVMNEMCTELENVAAKPGGKHAWWKHLCRRDGTETLRILSPNMVLSVPPDILGVDAAVQEQARTYFDEYVDAVWQRYATEPLRVDTQISPAEPGQDGWDRAATGTGSICDCTTAGGGSSNIMTCNCPAVFQPEDLQTVSFQRPTGGDIFSCSTGPFAAAQNPQIEARQLRARLCAGFVRTTLLLDSLTPSINVPATEYYKTGVHEYRGQEVYVDTHDYYSEIEHRYLKDGFGYTFSFDDVNPGIENAAGVIEMADPEFMNIVAGGWKDGDERPVAEIQN